MDNQKNQTKAQPDEQMPQGTGSKPKVRNQHEGKTLTPDDIVTNKSDLGGLFDTVERPGLEDISPGTSTSDELEERDSDTPVDDDKRPNVSP